MPMVDVDQGPSAPSKGSDSMPKQGDGYIQPGQGIPAPPVNVPVANFLLLREQQ